jgi:hypothetical protein
MRIEMDRFSFEMPSGFEDNTNYTFKDRNEQENLTVSFGERPPEATSLRKLMAVRRGNLDLEMSEDTKIEAEADTRVDGLPGRMLVYTFKSGNRSFRARWAIALPAPEMYLQISYIASAADAKAGQRFNHICDSAVAARKTVLTATPAGYVRRWAERMTLDVPLSLSPPLVYEFLNRENRDISLLLQYQEPQHPRTMPSTQEDLARDAAVGVIGDRQSRALAGDYGTGSLTSYSITALGESETRAHLADLALRNGVQLRVSIHGPLGSDTELKQTLARFIQSIAAK